MDHQCKGSAPEPVRWMDTCKVAADGKHRLTAIPKTLPDGRVLGVHCALCDFDPEPHMHADRAEREVPVPNESD
jgi:hypothetical protein